MASKIAQILKQEATDAPVEFFEPLTFGDLKNGQLFISMPSPGDNCGHGGFKGGHYIFKKMSETTGIRKHVGTYSSFVVMTPVILVIE